MEEQLNPLAVTQLLQHTLRGLCTHGDPQWVYAVFWRILPRNYPPPKWDLQGGVYDRSRGNRRNWILAWEDGFCNFAASACDQEDTPAAAAGYTDYAAVHEVKGLQPELFFKMSHDIYNYGEGLIGKVAADQSHKWGFQEANEHEINLIASWNNPADSHPRTWEAQFQSGIKTIALIAVREGVVQLGSMRKVAEDLSYVVALRRKFGYLESIPGRAL
uniref:Transcription factor MYC/MYB N-terminal domain-containing protein n=1 Tax=Oryza brachyantha TaxID=4533 RepID=J3LGZ7_ORYBR